MATIQRDPDLPIISRPLDSRESAPKYSVHYHMWFSGEFPRDAEIDCAKFRIDGKRHIDAIDCARLSEELSSIGFWEMGETDFKSAATTDGGGYWIEACEGGRGCHTSWHQLGNVPEFDRVGEFALSLAAPNRHWPGEEIDPGLLAP